MADAVSCCVRQGFLGDPEQGGFHLGWDADPLHADRGELRRHVVDLAEFSHVLAKRGNQPQFIKGDWAQAGGQGVQLPQQTVERLLGLVQVPGCFRLATSQPA